MAESIIFSNIQENPLSFSFDVNYDSDLGLQPILSAWSFNLETYFNTTKFINPLSLSATAETDSYTCEYLDVNKYHITLYGKLMHYGTFTLNISQELTINDVTSAYNIESDKLLCYLPPKFIFGEIHSKNYIPEIGSKDQVIPYNSASIPTEILSSNSAYPYFEQNYENSTIYDQTSGARPNYYEVDSLYTNGYHFNVDSYLSGKTIKASTKNDNIYQVNCSGIIPLSLANRYKFPDNLSAYTYGIYDTGRNIIPINILSSAINILSGDDYVIYDFKFNIDNSANFNLSTLGTLYISANLIEYGY